MQRTVLIIVLNDSFECLCYSFSCVYNTGSEIISIVMYISLNIYSLCCFWWHLSTLDIYSRLSIFLLSTLDFLLSTFTLDSRRLLSTLDIYSRHLLSTLDSRPSTFRCTLVWSVIKDKIRLGAMTCYSTSWSRFLVLMWLSNVTDLKLFCSFRIYM